MFTAYWTLNKKSPLARIWLVAHMQKKLTKAMVSELNIKNAVDEVKKANGEQESGLRTTGYLLLGIVKIFEKKTSILLTDANDIVAMLKMAFKPSVQKIILQEDDKIRRDPTPRRVIEYDMDLEREEESSNGIRATERREITLREEDLFDFDDRPMSQRTIIASEVPLNGGELDFVDEPMPMDEVRLARASSLFGNEESWPADVEGRREGTARSITPLGQGLQLEELQAIQESPSFEDMFEHPRETSTMWASHTAAAANVSSLSIPSQRAFQEQPMEVEEPAPPAAFAPDISTFEPADGPTSFTLQPLNVSDLPVRQRARRRRRLVIDVEPLMSDEQLRNQIENYGDTMRPALDLAPPSRQLMRIKEAANIDQMINPGSRWLIGRTEQSIYTEHAVVAVEEGGEETVGSIAPLVEGLQLEELQTIQESPSFEDMFEHPRETSTMWASHTAAAADVSSLSIPSQRSFQEELMEVADVNSLSSIHTSADRAMSSAERKDFLGKVAVALKHSEEVSFSRFARKCDTKRTIARKFYGLLEAKKNREIGVRQEDAYSEIFIRGDVNLVSE
ncbi:hypothetical protein QR680_006429 [Steinernema hermaphroditum]|uniref:Rad21/Rec8-like protein N-terminal domain-containing protein n=1 Tax=Steinernema hermaphroditum TaxID=289476 RepID=A0AA39LXE7_9BILA|nr:hypothetical protein QR680_006429 [Steinernema hermaphroditum]